MGSQPAAGIATDGAQACFPAELAIVVPTFNEVDNVAHLVALVAQALPGGRWR